VNRITKAALGGIAGCALVLGGTQAAIGDSIRQFFSGKVFDLDSAGARAGTTGAFDSAKALLKMTETSEGSTTLWLRVKGIDVDFAGKTFGSHLHTGVCDPTAEDPYNAVGPHFKLPLDPENQSQAPLREREVWFDLIPNEDGVAVDKSLVPVVPWDLDDGVMSIVIHAQATDEGTGLAGSKEVCLPVDVTTT